MPFIEGQCNPDAAGLGVACHVAERALINAEERQAQLFRQRLRIRLQVGRDVEFQMGLLEGANVGADGLFKTERPNRRRTQFSANAP